MTCAKPPESRWRPIWSARRDPRCAAPVLPKDFHELLGRYIDLAEHFPDKGPRQIAALMVRRSCGPTACVTIEHMAAPSPNRDKAQSQEHALESARVDDRELRHSLIAIC